MSDILICDMFNALPVAPEFNNNPSLVQIAGYTPDDLRIKELLLAGKLLEAFKYGYTEVTADYDFDEQTDCPDDYDAPDEYLDEMEAQDLYNQSCRRIAESMKAREAEYSRRLREEQEWKETMSKLDEVEEAPTKEQTE